MVALRLLLLGAPGSGKGTQSEVLRRQFGIPQLSTGDMLRQALAAGTELGLKAKDYMERGVLVPDDVMIGLMRDRITQPDCVNGYILDGFPRTVPQATALDQMLKSVDSRLDVVCEIVVPDSDLLKRLSGRWLCKKCGASYHVEFRPSKAAGQCDSCNGPLYQRPDDTIETARKRLEVYRKETLPLAEYYKQQGILKTINGVGSVEEIEQRLLSAIGKTS
ncbi:MAG: adenylate kinase [Deltaproteobacteria bacterium CG11_big_fil_rev_8_21_14_0_20_47_16]|nr:MAG: adenylate kinase [Deltaproteobacteria bacterium CG11_big_fil_rev_8_21_14_0_20_47_16]